jgi:hypothetical protein
MKIAANCSSWLRSTTKATGLQCGLGTARAKGWSTAHLQTLDADSRRSSPPIGRGHGQLSYPVCRPVGLPERPLCRRGTIDRNFCAL